MEWATTAVIGVVGLCFLILYLMNSLEDEKHFVLKLLLLFWVVAAFLLIPKVVVDSGVVCEGVVSNATVSGNVTSYEYTDFCYARSESTGKSFLRLTQVLYVLVIGYAVVYLFVWALRWLMDSVRRRGG